MQVSITIAQGDSLYDLAEELSRLADNGWTLDQVTFIHE
jgi:hypothetical protein